MEAQNLVESENDSVEKENVVTLIILSYKDTHLKCSLEYAENKFLDIDEDINSGHKVIKTINDKDYNTELFTNSLSNLDDNFDHITVACLGDKESALQGVAVMAVPEVHYILLYATF